MSKPTRKRTRRHHPVRLTEPGAPPGTVRVASDAPPVRVRAITYGPDQLEEHEVTKIEDLRGILGKAPVTWVNVEGMGDVQALEELGAVFEIHPLALEDVVNTHQRPKLEEYEDHQYMVLHAASTRVEDDNPQVVTEQISLFLGTDYVLTLQERPGDSFGALTNRLRGKKGKLRAEGADYLAYALIDATIDFYFPVLETLGDEVDQLERQIMEGRRGDALQRIYALKHELMALRRIVFPLRDVLSQLSRGDVEFVGKDTQIYFRDCYDHSFQVLDVLESVRETASNLMDLHQNAIAQRMNEVMKVLTVIATIFIPLSFIAGLYGMNFDSARSPWNMPELRWRYGYPMALGLMVAVAAGLLGFFWRRGWLSSDTAAPRPPSDQP